MELTRINRKVFDAFKRSKYDTKVKMATILKEQLDNLQMLYDMMDKELDCHAMDTHDNH